MRLMIPANGLAMALTVALLAGCGDVSPTSSLSASGSAPTSGVPLETDADGVPVTLDYAVQGNPIVGQPVGVELSVESPLDGRPITLAYRVSEPGSLEFPESQVTSVEVVPVAGAVTRPVQVTVIPRRDGRVFLTVTATIETDRGSVRKAMSVPLQVAPAPLEEEGEESA